VVRARREGGSVITGAHTIVYADDPEAARVFFRDVLGFGGVDAGDGWLIFALPPGELAVHPAEERRHELFLMCDDIETTVEELKGRGVAFSAPVSDEGWGLLTRFEVPGAGSIGLYQPRHPSPLDLGE
jgi:catechol 2,3-dioxygenase-like lactoylglutathione lyase family enzyme